MDRDRTCDIYMRLTELPLQGGGSRGRGGGYYHSNPHYEQYYQNKYSRDRDTSRDGGGRRGGYDGGEGSRNNDFRLGRYILGRTLELKYSRI